MTEREFNEKLNNIDNKFVKDVLYLSNFIKEKGYEYVLELAKLAKEEYDKSGIKKFHFHFAGKFFSEDDKNIFLNYIENNKLKDFVTYHGIVTGKEKKELLKKCDVFVLLTTYPKEGQPISILEAMGNGMAIVTTNHAGIPDILKHNQCNIMLDKNMINKNDIFMKIIKVNYKECLIENCKISKSFSQENYISNIEKIFKELY